MCRYSLVARFESQPPEDLRKSNFFNFRVELRTENGLVDVVAARFEHYLNEGQNGTPNLKNGIKYSVTVRYPNETTERKDLYLMLVDAATHEPIQYEGHDCNPKMQRVLLTHETICTRCSLNKSCGNKNEAPSDPGIAARGVLKFFLKCNQNCLKGAGNPRDMRRFALAVSFEDMTFDKSRILAVSGQMFVHNNSKHSRKRKKTGEEGTTGPMRVFHVTLSGGNRVTVVGENLQPGTRVFIDGGMVPATHRSEHVLEAWLPPQLFSPSSRVALQHGEHFLDVGSFENAGCASNSGHIATVSPSKGCCGGEMDFISSWWAVPGVAFLCGDLNLPVAAMVKNTALRIKLPFNLAPGLKTITVVWNNRAQFAFPYMVQDGRKDQGLAETDEYLCLLRKGFNHYEVSTERNNIWLCVEEFDGEPFNRALEWSGYVNALRYYELSPSYSSSSSDGILHLSGSDHSPPL